MGSSAPEDLVRQLARSVMFETEPALSDHFDDVADAYFSNRNAALAREDTDAPLAFGDEIRIGLEFVTLFVAEKVVEYYVARGIDVVHGRLRRLTLGRRASGAAAPPRSPVELPSLDPDQVAGLHTNVAKEAKRKHISSEQFEQVFEVVQRRLREPRS